jgi:hypothetical protein
VKLDDDIHNYYEQFVLQEIEARDFNASKDQDYVADLCCLALNQLPAKYIRHEVDMAFYLTSTEHKQMQMSVSYAVDKASHFLDSLPAKKD